MGDVETFSCPDPGPGARLDARARTALAKAARGWQRSQPAAVVVEVEGRAWAHVPDVSDLPDRAAITDAQVVVAALHALDCPVLVAVGGAVSGLGTALLLATDVRVADTGTTVTVGDTPAAGLLGGTGWLAERAGAGTAARRLTWTGDVLTAEAALAAGLLTVSGTASDAHAYAATLAADPSGWSAVKRAERSRTRHDLAETLRYQSWLTDIALRP